jgi:hypothetical protein
LVCVCGGEGGGGVPIDGPPEVGDCARGWCLVYTTRAAYEIYDWASEREMVCHGLGGCSDVARAMRPHVIDGLARESGNEWYDRGRCDCETTIVRSIGVDDWTSECGATPRRCGASAIEHARVCATGARAELWSTQRRRGLWPSDTQLRSFLEINWEYLPR